MPKGPQGEWRPVGDNECAALVCRIALGESSEVYEPPEDEKARRDATEAGMARAEALEPGRRREIAKAGAAARWGGATFLALSLAGPAFGQAPAPDREAVKPEAGKPGSREAGGKPGEAGLLWNAVDRNHRVVQNVVYG